MASTSPGYLPAPPGNSVPADVRRLAPAVLERLDTLLAPADAVLRRAYPGDPGTRQPVHTVYVPAGGYDADLVQRWSDRARQALASDGGNPEAFAAATGVAIDLVEQVYQRVVSKLEIEPIEDLRIDFEDGYGHHGDTAEDAVAVAAARYLARSAAAGTAPPFTGIRFKSLEAPTRRRGIATLDLFLGTLTDTLGGLPSGFVLTLPKVTSVDQVNAMVELCGQLEQLHQLSPGSIRFELQIETPQAILGSDGVATVAAMIHTAAGRATALHYGTYDYSASVGISAGYQSMEHPAADHAKSVMQVAAAGTGIRLSDGSTNVLPVGDSAAVSRAWALHSRLIRRSLERGYYQGWDLHPAQLPTRFLATYAFYRDGMAAAGSRLSAYTTKADSGVMDEPATAQALAAFLVRGLHCGALTEEETFAGSGLDRTALDRLYLRKS